jgi:hypothetical protein
MIYECRYLDADFNWQIVWRPADVLPAVRSELVMTLPDQPQFRLRVLRHVYESGEGLPWLRCCRISGDADE